MEARLRAGRYERQRAYDGLQREFGVDPKCDIRQLEGFKPE